MVVTAIDTAAQTAVGGEESSAGTTDSEAAVSGADKAKAQQLIRTCRVTSLFAKIAPAS